MHDTLLVSSRLDQIGFARRWATKHAREAGFGDEDVWAIELALAEALSNVIRHGYGGAPDEEIRLALLGMRCDASTQGLHLVSVTMADAEELLHAAPRGSIPWAQAMQTYLSGLLLAGRGEALRIPRSMAASYVGLPLRFVIAMSSTSPPGSTRMRKVTSGWPVTVSGTFARLRIFCWMAVANRSISLARAFSAASRAFCASRRAFSAASLVG